ncbi:fused response regulator/phosphatase [Streptacidiphilus sp. N1-10]|uniref:Fused response regulator/phosphatase n=1 Tax=Streptacidiphilus jeojiensis TaxID=3229225 RepID=A0ABV6XRQ7_9ACTN
MTHAEGDDIPAVVLIVEDNATNRYILGSWLSRAGHTVLEAEDGGQGLALLEERRSSGEPMPELAVVDVHLPDMSGFEVCERIKDDPFTTGIPVIHVSATAIGTGDRTQGLYRGADAYLTEPIAPSELLATVTSALRYSRARSRAERLAQRLTTLNEVTLEIYAAPGAETLAAAAARGASALIGSAAAVLTQSPHADTVHLTHITAAGRPSSGQATTELLARLSAPGLGSRTGVAVTDLPEVGALPLQGAVTLVAARTKRGRPPVCIAVEAAAATTGEDRKLLTQFAQACALALEALRSYTEEHTLAVTLQRAFLPGRLPQRPGVRLAVRYIAATAQNEIGGDFYEAVETPTGLLLAVGDVVGHSLEAAVVMGELRHALRAYAIDGHGPRAVLERLDTLLTTVRPGWTATICLVLVAPDGGSVEIANAGHLPPLLLEPVGGEGRFVREHGPLLGLNLPQPDSVRREIPPGTVLLLVTDGLVEVRGVDLTVSLEQLRTAAAGAPRDPEQLCRALLDSFDRPQEDDIVLFAARIGAVTAAHEPPGAPGTVTMTTGAGA